MRATYPDLHISKNKIQLSSEIDIDEILNKIKQQYAKHPVNTVDGIRIELDNDWVHLRKSNTEPVIRIYAESDSPHKADVIARKLLDDIRKIIKEESDTTLN